MKTQFASFLVQGLSIGLKVKSLKGFSSRWPSYHGCHINSSHFKQE